MQQFRSVSLRPLITGTFSAFTVFSALYAGVLNAKSETISQAEKAVRMQQFDQAFDLYMQSAESGDADAQYQLANLYLKGLGADKDQAMARFWLDKAVAQGHSGAQYTLSQILRDKPRQARELLESAALQGYAPARMQLERKAPVVDDHIASSFEIQWMGAVRKNDLKQLKGLSSGTESLATRDGVGRNAVFYAVEFNSLDVLDWLIEQGANVNLADKNGVTPLQVAILSGSDKALRRLLAAGGNIKQSLNNGDNLLHYAIRLKRYNYVDSLMKAGVILNQQNNEGFTPLDLAQYQKERELSNKLIAAGAKTGSSWREKRAPQDVAAVASQLSQQERHVSPVASAIINNNFKLLKSLVQSNANVIAQPLDRGTTPLELAVRQNKLKMVKALLALGADVTQPASGNTTVLHIATRAGYVDVAQSLLEAGASVIREDESGENVLSSAFKEGREDIGLVLIDHVLGGDSSSAERKRWVKDAKIPVDKYILSAVKYRAAYAVERLLPYTQKKAVVDAQQKNALWYAAKNKEPKLVKQLLNADVSPAQADNLGRTPFVIAVESGCLPCAMHLLRVSDVNHQTASGNAALMLAALNRDAVMTAWLLKNKAEVDIRNEKGETALMAAVNIDDLKIAQQLISADASVSRKNKLGFSVLDLAEGASPNMLKLIKSQSVLGVF